MRQLGDLLGLGMAGAAGTDAGKGPDTGFLTGGFLGHDTVIQQVTQSGDLLTLFFHTASSAERGGGHTGLGTGGILAGFVSPSVAQRIHLFGIAVALGAFLTDGTGEGLLALVLTVGLDGHGFLVLVARGIHVVIHVAVGAAGAGVGGVTLVITGRSSHNTLVVMLQSGNDLGIDIAAAGAGKGLQTHKPKGNDPLNGLALDCRNGNTLHDLRGHIPGTGQKTVENTGTDTHNGNRDDIVYGHSGTVTTESVLPFQMIQHICKQCHKHIGTGQTAHILDELSHQNDDHIFRGQPADGAAHRHQNHAGHGHIPLAKLLCQGPHRKDTNAHGNAAQNRNQRLGNAIVVGTQYIVAVIHQADVLNTGSDC